MKFTSLTQHLVVWFVLVALLPLLLFGYLSLQQNQATLHAETQARMTRLADKKAMEIKNYLAERVQDSQLLARGMLVEQAMSTLSRTYSQHHPDSIEYRNADKLVRSYFPACIEDCSLFSDVFLITPQGEIIYTDKHEADFATNLYSGPYRDSQLARAFRESSMTLESGLSSFEIYAPSGKPAAFVTAPIMRGGIFHGVIAFQLNTEKIYQVALEAGGLGATGETLLAELTASGEAKFVAPLRHDPQAAMQRKINMQTANIPTRNALLGRHGDGVGTDYSGRQVIAAWRYLPELRWGMVVKIDADEAFAPIYQQRRTLLEILLGLILLAGVTAIYLGRQLVAPLRAFVLTADQVALGDLGKRVKETRTDEIGALARAFNRMAGSLQSLYRSLEERVQERTRELNAANEQLQEELVFREHIEMAMSKSQVELQRNQDLLNEAQRLGQLGSWVLNPLTGELEWSNETFRIFELDPAQFSPSYNNFLNIIHPDDRERVNQAYTQSLKDKQAYDIEHRVIMADGRIKWVREHCASNFDESGKVIRSMGAVQDITGQKLAEEKLRVAAATFETHEAILITDANANIIRVNRTFTEVTGYPPEEVLGKNPHILSSGRQDKSFYAEMWRQLLESGTWSGEMWDRRKNGQIYPKWLNITAIKNAQGMTTEYVGIFRDITTRKQAEAEIHNLAFYDVLTSLPNRRLLLDRFHFALSASARSHHYGAVLFLDMDNFKTLNDTLGHAYGDLMLMEVARRIQYCVREVDTVARFGGDEFVILIEEISTDAQDTSQRIVLIAEKIRAALVTPYRIKGNEYHSSPSIGVCMYRGTEETVDELLKRADLAMYQAKDAGRNTVRFFDPVMQQAVEMHAALEADLRRALPNLELHLYYQIQVDNEYRPLGAEALLRWIHPQRGMVSPAQFIPVAEESALILDIGHWVLQTACRQLAVWGENEHTRNLTLAVNVSARQFGLQDFVDRIAAVLRESRAEPSRLKLELTEGMVLSDVADVVAKMRALKALGVSLSMDDFGTGYSSLSYLKQLPLDQIKIDQSFVRDIVLDNADAVMVKTIIDMARNFNLNVIAEGVETGEQLDFLERNGCMAYQGYLFSKPVPIDEFEILLKKLQGS
ncbi:MAG TPA: EAL domain-containing protein [Gallionella sp.]|nr:EAL domain-containing protein [Gallionella sp.]